MYKIENQQRERNFFPPSFQLDSAYGRLPGGNLVCRTAQ